MSKKRILFITTICIATVILGLYSSYAMITNGVISFNNADYTFTIGNLEDQEISVTANSTKTIDIKITNPYEGTLNYGLVYESANLDNITIGVLSTSASTALGTIETKQEKTISLAIKNSTDNDIVIKLSLITGYINGGDLIIPEGSKLITDRIDINSLVDTNLDESGANKPNTTDEMIPIYYDEEDLSWHKADIDNTNSDYEWYDYNNKKWANIVLVKTDKLKYYQDLELGEKIEDEDVLAYFVWIPRFKYLVWNLNKEDGNTYDALNNGINIVFEKNTDTTGEIICDGDTCNGKEYYTHPAFKLGDTELTGFWIGKFETTGTSTEPTILPNSNSITSLAINDAFSVSRLFTINERYNIKDKNIDSHLIKNYEWNAVSYLTYSTYGICNGTINGCRNIYKNNSSYHITGVSAGNTDAYSDYGYYSYKGESLDTYGMPMEIIDTSTISSTTGNIYGVYDLVGGAYEMIMATTDTNSDYLKNIDNKYYDIISNNDILGTTNNLISEINIDSYLLKGGNFNTDTPTLFTTIYYEGDANPDTALRIILS